jgi:hypothetical protein
MRRLVDMRVPLGLERIRPGSPVSSGSAKSLLISDWAGVSLRDYLLKHLIHLSKPKRPSTLLL